MGDWRGREGGGEIVKGKGIERRGGVLGGERAGREGGGGVRRSKVDRKCLCDSPASTS